MFSFFGASHPFSYRSIGLFLIFFPFLLGNVIISFCKPLSGRTVSVVRLSRDLISLRCLVLDGDGWGGGGLNSYLLLN